MIIQLEIQADMHARNFHLSQTPEKCIKIAIICDNDKQYTAQWCKYVFFLREGKDLAKCSTGAIRVRNQTMKDFYGITYSRYKVI